MRKILLAALVAVAVVLAGTTAMFFTKYKRSAADFESMKVTEQSTRDRYDQTIEAIAEIQDSLNAIALGDANVKMSSGGTQVEQQLAGPNKGQALDRISDLRASISRYRERIHRLESSLKTRGMKINGLEKMVANLKQSLTEKEQLVAELSTRVDTLQTQVTGLQGEVAQNQTVIEDKRRELATVYVAVGNKKELTTQGVIIAKGGVLGLGKTLQPSGASNAAAFTPVDTDQETVVPIPSAKAKVLSAQPPTSYELRLVGDRMELHIINLDEFRKVRQVVILTA